jgi:arylsulfatase A-like enzyme
LSGTAKFIMRLADDARSAGSRPYWKGLGLAAFLAVALLVITLLQTLTTFFIRLYDADVMLRAVGNVSLESRVSLDIAFFVIGLLVVHGLLALAVHALAVLTGLAWPAICRFRNGFVVVWFALAVAAILLLNAHWFPRSHGGTYYGEFASRSLGPVSVAWGITLLAVGLAIAVLTVVLWRQLPAAIVAWRRAPAAYIATFLVAALVFGAATRGTAPAKAMPDRANIVILGVDSLRLGELDRFEGRGWTPNIDRFLHKADLFRDSTTPLARTFPSWMSILTGRSPRSTGAVFNLIRREDINDHPTIADVLAAEGYTTVYATDEVRFANIDESYGFDRVITPPIGAADFLIGQIGDIPLSNILANTQVGGFLLRYLHANRGIAFLYRPTTFVDRLQNELPAGRPVFAAIHLTVAHWPYFHAGTPLGLQQQATETSNPAYREALQTADRMFGDVIDVLQSKGILDNAVVVVLSDHGEALGMPSDSLLNGSDGLDGQVAELQAPVAVLKWGHGQSVLSPVQYQVLLGFRGFGSQAAIGAQGRDLLQTASLEDVVPTLMDLLGERAPVVDGISLAPSLWSPLSDGGPHAQRIRFTETDFVITLSDSGELDEEDAARQAARLLEVDPASGWLQWRPAMVRPLLAKKERAALDDTHLLAAMPVAPSGHQYLLLNRRSGQGRILRGRPEQSDPSAQRLWDALHANFAGELDPPVVVTPEVQQPFARQAAERSISNAGAKH